MIGGLQGLRLLLGGGASLFLESGGAGWPGGRTLVLGLSGRSEQPTELYCVEKVDLVPGSSVLAIPDRTQQS